jgi:hypothetical protein
MHMGAGTFGVRLLAVLSSLGAAPFALVAHADFAGGGSVTSDCYVVVEGFEIKRSRSVAECRL